MIVWDGGNNDTPFVRPNLHLVVVDPHRPGHELRYHPGETNLRMAHACVVNKVDSADQAGIDAVLESIRTVNPDAKVVLANSPIHVEENGTKIAGKRVLAIEDGPTLTHGEMTFGAAVLAAKAHGAAELVDPRPHAVGSIAATFAEYPHVSGLLPAMGYGRKQMDDLAETIKRSDPELVLVGTPIDLRRLIDFEVPALRVTYRLEEVGEPTLADVLGEYGLIGAARRRRVTLVVALGGNALGRGTAAEQLETLRDACEALAPLVREGEVVVTHGNGPQVGNELLRQERAADEVPPLPLYLAVAQTQAEIGALIEAELSAAASRPVACLLTHVHVDPDDPAFRDPTKPIGPFYSEDEARMLGRDRGWQLVEDSGRGFRRVVPSPRPLDVVELESIRALVATGAIAVACGGGGIPVVSRNGHFKGVDAVIDKDRASALLATKLGADRLVILTEVPAVYRNYRKSNQQELRELRLRTPRSCSPASPRARCSRRSGRRRLRPRRRRDADHLVRRLGRRARRPSRHAYPGLSYSSVGSISRVGTLSLSRRGIGVATPGKPRTIVFPEAPPIS